MKLSSLILVVYVGYMVVEGNQALGSSVPSVEELERKAINYRLENCKRGYVRMQVSNEIPRSHNLDYLYEITFDERRVRQISRSRPRGELQWGEPQKIIVTPNIYIIGDEDAKEPTVVKIAPAKNYKSPKEHFGVLNVQALGMDANGADGLYEAHVESLMNRSDRTTPVVHTDVRGGVETWKIEYVLKNQQGETGLRVSLWIAPSRGYSVVGIDVQSDQDGKRYTSIIDTQMKQYPVGDTWYPCKVIKTVKEDDQVFDRQVITIEEARFGGPIDETAFTPAGLDLKPGREVVDSTSGQPWLKVWDGKELVKPTSVKTAPANPVRPRRPRWLLLSLAAGLGLLAFFYFWRVIKQRRSGPNPGP